MLHLAMQNTLRSLMLLTLSASSIASINIFEACSCSAGRIPVPVAVRIPVNPGSETLNTTNLRELHATFGIFGTFCQPATRSNSPSRDHVQLLLHGSTYTSQYWTWPINGFQNYSYAAHACAQGQSTFAYDALGVGLSERPLDSTDVQIPTSAAIAASLARKLKTGEVTELLGMGPQQFSRLVAVGHSQGSVVFNFAAIELGRTAPFDALILTGHIHDEGFLASIKLPRPAARDVDPARWANLEPGYISNPNRSQFYSPDNSTFSADMLQVDQLTKDVSTVWYVDQTPAVYVPAREYKGPVVELVGDSDQIHCLNVGDGSAPCNVTALQTSESEFWPHSRNFAMIVREGQGHDVNLDFGAAETFKIITALVKNLT